jgi:ABC-2 type transport system permease protein
VYGWARLPPEYGQFKNLTDGIVVQLWDVIGSSRSFVAPFLSMRLFAEEKRNRTFELLMTAPVRPWEIVLGKYLGGVGVIWATLGLTIIFPITLSLFGSSESGTALEWSTVALGFGGLLLWGATCLGRGDVRLRADREPDARGFPHLRHSPALDAAPRGWRRARRSPGGSIANHSPSARSSPPLSRGVLDLKALVFFLSVILFSLLLTHRTVEAQRWA